MNFNIEKLLMTVAEEVFDVSPVYGMKPGHNGPYFDKETPVRNTAHWLMIFSCLYRRTKESRYRHAAYSCFSYLNSKEARPMNASFFCRTNAQKDFCNGLMGQAWVIEALIYAYDTFTDISMYKLAEEVFLLHSFDNKRSIWFRLGVDGSHLSPDETFNHQLWFCAVGSMLNKTSDALVCCDQFFKNIATRPTLYKSGVLYHNSNIYFYKNELNLGLKSIVDQTYRTLVNTRNKKRLFSKSVGYHGFNLYAYELLKKRYSQDGFFSGSLYKAMLNVTQTQSFKKELLRSKYSYPYNPPAFEIGFALLNNGHSITIVKSLLEYHFKITKSKSGYNDAVSKDPRTSEARLYELVRILELSEVDFEI